VHPATAYARSGDVNIAYQTIGDEPPDLVLVPGFVSHVEAAWEWPYLARFLRRLASFSRLIVFDKRGTGLSDPMKRSPTPALRTHWPRASATVTWRPWSSRSRGVSWLPRARWRTAWR